MAINLTVGPIDRVAVLYFQDGSQMVVDQGAEQFVQVVTGGVCAVSDAASEDESEHIPPEEKAVAFAEKMITMWVGIADKAREKALAPTVTPV
jgi:hypothetical protein